MDGWLIAGAVSISSKPCKGFPPLSPALCSPQLTEIWEQRYEQRGIDSSYLFRVDDEWVVSASRGIAGSTGIPCLVQRVADEGVFLVK